MGDASKAAGSDGGETAEPKQPNRGYTYWKRDIDAGVVLPENKPQRIDAAAAAAARQEDEITRTASTGSRWNSAGTWEEKDVGAIAHTELEQVLCDPAFAILVIESDGTKVRITRATITGDANLVCIRGKPRVGHEFKVCCDWSGTFGSEEVSGKLEIDDLDSSDLDGIEIRPTGKSGSDASKRAAEALKKGARAAFKRAAEELQRRILER